MSWGVWSWRGHAALGTRFVRSALCHPKVSVGPWSWFPLEAPALLHPPCSWCLQPSAAPGPLLELGIWPARPIPLYGHCLALIFLTPALDSEGLRPLVCSSLDPQCPHRAGPNEHSPGWIMAGSGFFTPPWQGSGLAVLPLVTVS